MIFTVKEALQMRALEKCRVLTGDAGLNNEIKWVNILEILDDLRHIEPGEFLITTAFGFDFNDENKLKNLMDLFADTHMAALAIQTGHYVNEIPEALIRMASQHLFPVVEIPAEVSFKGITRALLGELVSRGQLDGNGDSPLGERDKLQNLIKHGRELLKRLITGENPKNLSEDLKKLRISLYSPYSIIYVSAKLREGEKESGLTESTFLFGIEPGIASLLSQYNMPFLVTPHHSCVSVLLQPAKNLAGQAYQTAQRLQQELELLHPSLIINIGVSSSLDSLEDIKIAIDEAAGALEAAELRLCEDKAVVDYCKLGSYQLLMAVGNPDFLKRYVQRTVGPLLDYDRRSNGALTKTLHTYLEHMNISETADILYIHRHTLRYRLNQIKELSGIDPTDPSQAIQLHLGLKAHDYLQARQFER